MCSIEPQFSQRARFFDGSPTDTKRELSQAAHFAAAVASGAN
jgi:hypothetical protein